VAEIPSFLVFGPFASYFVNVSDVLRHQLIGTNLLDCSFLAADIQKCQAKGKTVTISLGGAISDGTPSAALADQIWNLFLGGSSATRPFGSAVLDGIDLDIEQGSDSYVPFVQQLRS
jgi:chitinase